MSDNIVVFIDDYKRRKAQKNGTTPAFTWFDDARLRHPSCIQLVRQIIAGTLDALHVDPKTKEYEVHAVISNEFNENDLAITHLTRDELEQRVRAMLARIMGYLPKEIYYLDELPEQTRTELPKGMIALVIRLR